jgi:hypothetical protein
MLFYGLTIFPFRDRAELAMHRKQPHLSPYLSQFHFQNHKRKANAARTPAIPLDTTLTEVEEPAFPVADAAGADEDEDDPDDAEDDLLAELLDRDAVPVTEVTIPDVVDAVVEGRSLADASDDDEEMLVVGCDSACVV